MGGSFLGMLLGGLVLVLTTGCGGSGSGGGLLTGTPTDTSSGSGSGTTSVPPGVSTTVVQNPDSILLVSSSAQSVALLGSGGSSTSILTFEVRNQIGQPMDGVCVSFTLESGGIGGGENVNPGLQTSTSCGSVTVNGQVTTTFRGGTKAGTVNVIAFLDTDDDGTIDGGEIKATATVSVNSGPPFGNHLEVGVEKPNGIVALGSAGNYSVQGASNAATFFVSDRFTNPVPDGTVVTFRTIDPVGLTPAATVDGSGATAGGNSQVTVNTRSQNPAPSDGLVDVLGFTQGGADASVLSLLRTGGGAGPLYAGTDGGGIYRSLDNGSSWTLVGEPDTGLFDGFVRQMIVNPQNTNEIFAVTNRGVYSSLTGGNWTRRDGSARIFNELATPTCSAPATTCATWTVALTPDSISRTRVEIDGVRTRHFYITGGVGTGKEIRLTEPNNPTTVGQPDKGDPREINMTTQRVSVSYDVANRLPSFPATCIEADSRIAAPAAGRLWVGLRGGGVYRSDNGGLDWTQMNNGLNNVNIQDLAYDGVNNILYVATEGGGVFRYVTPDNANLSWEQRFGTGAGTLLDLNATTIDVDSTGSLLVVGTKTSGVQYSNNGGVTWNLPAADTFRSASPPDIEVAKVRALSALNVVALTVDDENPDVTSGNLWVSTDGGTSFSVVGSANPSPFVSRFNQDVLVNGAEILVAGRGRSVNRSTNSVVPPFTGATFTDATGALPNRIGNQLFAGTSFMYGGPLFFDFYLDPSRSSNCDIGAQTVFRGGHCGFRVTMSESANDRPLTQGASYSASLVLDPETPSGGLSGTASDDLASHYLRAGDGVTEFYGAVFNSGVLQNTSARVDIAVASDNGNFNFSPTFLLSPSESQDDTGVSTEVTQVPDSILLAGASAQAVALLGSGGSSTSILTFEVRNEIGQPMDGVCVSFTLENGGIGGGESVNPGFQPTTGCAAVTENGQISTTFRGGTKAGTVNVIAFLDADGDNAVDGDEIKATATVSVNSGPPFGNHLGIVTQSPNHTVALAGDGSFSIQGATNQVSVLLSDRFTNPVPDGTVVTFRTFDPVALTPSANVEGSGATASGASSVAVNTRSQNPAPTDGIVDAIGFTQGGADATVLSLLKVGTDLYAGTDGGGIYRSLDNGQSWTRVGEPDTGLFDGFVREMAVNPQAGNQIFAVTNRGVYFSPTGGNWTRRDGTARVFNEVPTNTCGAGACARWDLNLVPLSHARTEVRIDGVRTRNFYITGTDDIVLTDGSAGTRTVNPATQAISVSYDLANFLPPNPTTCIEADTRVAAPAVGRFWVGVLGSGVYRTDNGGLSWNAVNDGLTNVNVKDLTYDADNNILYAATEGGGVFRHLNPDNAAASTWVPVNGTFPNHLLDLHVTTLSSFTTGGGTTDLLVAGTQTSGVLYSTDNGATWLQPGGGTNPFRSTSPQDAEVTKVKVLDASTVVALTIDDENPDVTTGNLWVSTDTAANFAPVTVTGPSATTTAAAATFVSRFNQDVLVTPPLATAEVLVGGRGRSVNRITNLNLAAAPSPAAATAFVDATGVLPNRIGNGLFAGVTYMYGGPTYVNVFFDPPGHFSSAGCNLAGGIVPNGETCAFRLVIAESAHDRPLSEGSNFTVTLSMNPADPAAILAGTLSRTLSSHHITSAQGVTDYYYELTNAGVATAGTAQIAIEVTSDNGNVTRQIAFQLTP